jgi:hypothetical protein
MAFEELPRTNDGEVAGDDWTDIKARAAEVGNDASGYLGRAVLQDHLRGEQRKQSLCAHDLCSVFKGAPWFSLYQMPLGGYARQARFEAPFASLRAWFRTQASYGSA